MKTILFVPAPGDKHGLLSPGKCGARPPRMRGHKNHQGKITHWDSEEPNPEWEDVSALVLALEGKMRYVGSFKPRDGTPVHHLFDARPCDGPLELLAACGDGT